MKDQGKMLTNGADSVKQYIRNSLRFRQTSDGRRVYSVLVLPTTVSTTTVGSIESASQDHVNGLRHRKKATEFYGTPTVKKMFAQPFEDETNIKPQIKRPVTWAQWEEHVASKIIKGVVWLIPTRWNQRAGDITETPWEYRLRVQWLDRGLYKRKILAAVVIGLLVAAMFLGAGYVPWRQLFGKDSIPKFKDAHGRILNSVVIPRMLEPDKHAGDIAVSDWIKTGDPFEPVTPAHLKEGYITVTMDHSGTRKNVSLPMLYNLMNATAYGKYRCLCAAHMGIPLNMILFTPIGERLRAIQNRQDTPLLPNDFVFMIEPQPTIGSNAIVSTGPMTSNIESVPFRVNHPTRVVVSFLTNTGHKDKREMHGDDAACVVRCIELAWKEPVVDPLMEGILTTPASQRKENRKIYVSEN